MLWQRLGLLVKRRRNDRALPFERAVYTHLGSNNLRQEAVSS